MRHIRAVAFTAFFLLLLGGAAYLLTRQPSVPQPGAAAPLPSSPGPPSPSTVQSGQSVVLPRAALGPYGSFEAKGQPAWDLSRDPELVAQHGAGRDAVLVLRCDCGKIIRLLGHRVSPEGHLTPSLWHDVPECGWHVFGRLEDWDQGEWSAGQP